MRTWIPIEERLPEKGEKVFIATTLQHVWVAVFKDFLLGHPIFVSTEAHGGEYAVGIITHWMPYFPPLPSSKGSGSINRLEIDYNPGTGLIVLSGIDVDGVKFHRAIGRLEVDG
jgi:hypothetical protein